MARFTLLDVCGAPVSSPCGSITTDGFISVEAKANLFEPDAIEVAKASGQLCASDQACSQLKWYDLAITLCQVNPELLALLTGNTVIDDWTGTNPVGYEIGSQATCPNFALELWTTVLGQACPPGGLMVSQYGYFLYPFVTGGVLGDHTIENDALSLEIDARTKDGSNWGVGIYDVVAQDALNTPGPLNTPVGDDAHERFEVTTIPPPAAVCACQPVVVPSS
jgi:hypothetical protein